MNHPALKRVGLPLALAAFGVTALTGCSPAAEAARAAAAGSVSVEAAERSDLRSFYRQKPSWTRCGELQCATLTVPMDYAHPQDGRTFTLPLVKAVTADPAQRIGSLVFNPGGPGESGVAQLESGGAEGFGKRARAHFDIVSFDPRGVGGSKPAVDCAPSNPAAEDESISGGTPASLYPKTDAERSAALKDAEAQSAACKARSGAILPHVGTLDAARDLDVLRAALGDDKLTYLGWSYGTQLGTTYGELFPRRVRALVLDGAVDPALDWSEGALQQAKGFKKAVDDYAEQCASVATDACPATTPDGIRKVITDLFARVSKRPLPIKGTTERLDANGLTTAVSLSMYTPESQWKDLSEALRAAQKGDGTKLAALGQEDGSESEGEGSDDTGSDDAGTDGTGSDPGAAEERAPDNSSDALTAVNCLDTPHPRDPQAYWDLLDRAHREAGAFGTAGVLSTLTCKDWPAGQQEPHRVRAEGLPPVLVVGTTGDPATPYQWSESLAAQLPGGMLLTFRGTGHTAYGRSNTCVTDAVDAYLLDLTPVPGGKTC
ncbi:alpha/beta hydrolase [Streptomyces sp. ZAF1911]|uniref:alpha/beta hydrolase n=1 Tax=Streptomyces sp. ZAF1911 TaxID=2944129 RepID=UPI00237B4BDD|nr:alpha/beta hydrolase [Streptomyces sp. ZAF1911]MDD9375672.1 alpha/beta hydrolase [Streptomyces sp. ZAF1911]